MLDRQKIEAVLTRRFPGATHQQVAAAANAIMGLDDDWEEIAADGDVPHLSRESHDGVELRFFRRREGLGVGVPDNG